MEYIDAKVFIGITFNYIITKDKIIKKYTKTIINKETFIKLNTKIEIKICLIINIST